MQSCLRAVIFSVALLAGFAGLASERQVLAGHKPAVVAPLQPAGNLPALTRMDLAIGLPLRNRQGLTNLIQQLYDPASPNYRHYLTPGQFTELFGPTQQDYQKVLDFVQRQGLKVRATHPDRLLLDVTGSAAEVERAFRVTMRVYQHPTEARTFFAPDVDPSIDAGVPVLDVSGLDNYVMPHPTSLKAGALNPAVHPEPSAGSGPSGNYIGNDFRAAYVPKVPLAGTGQSVGLFELEGYYPVDITNYEHLAGLSSVPLTNVFINETNGNPDTNADYVAEVSLDIEMAISMAPGLSNVIVYEAPNTNFSLATVNDVLDCMATNILAKQLSSSWSWGGGSNALNDQYFLRFASQGQSFFEASGDSGAYRSTD